MATQQFINECKNGAYCNRLGKVIYDNTEITSSDYLSSIEINDGCYTNGSVVGSVYSKKALVNTFYSEENNNNLMNKTLDTHIGVKYANNSTEYINLGKYYVNSTNAEITHKNNENEGYDILYQKCEEEYECGLDFSTPKTLYDLYTDICSQIGLLPYNQTILNGDFEISVNPFQNKEKIRLALESVCKVSCSFVRITDNKLELAWLSNSIDYTFQTSDYTSVEGNDITYGPIHQVVIKSSMVDSENITLSIDSEVYDDDHTLTISEDYILNTQEKREQAIGNILNRVNGLEYTNCKLTTSYGKPFLKCGHKIRVYTDDNNYFDTYNLIHTFKYDGSFASVIESPVITSVEVKRKQTQSVIDKLKRTEIIVNKQEGTIQSIVESIDTINRTMLEQTDERISLWFQTSGTKELLENVEAIVIDEDGQVFQQQETLNKFNEYIHFEGAKITLGKENSTCKVVISNESIDFMVGENRCAYINNNQLYINEIVVMNKLQQGQFLDIIDNQGNLNKVWIGG